MRLPIIFSIMVAIAMVTLAKPIAAGNLYLYMEDPVGDNSGNIDVRNMSLVFDDQTGNYMLTVGATESKPFLGNFRININLFNPDTGPTSSNPSYFGDTFNDYNLATPTTELVLTGINANLTSWGIGDRVATTTLSGLGNFDDASFFRTAVGDLPLGPIFVREDIIGYDDRLAGSIDIGSVGYVSDAPPQEQVPDCNLRLVFPTGLNMGGPPTIDVDGNLYFAAGDAYAPGDFAVFSIKANGMVKAGWPYYLDASAISTVAVAADGTVYFGADDQYLYAIDSDGNEKWRFNTGDDLANWKSPAVSNNRHCLRNDRKSIHRDRDRETFCHQSGRNREMELFRAWQLRLVASGSCQRWHYLRGGF